MEGKAHFFGRGAWGGTPLNYSKSLCTVVANGVIRINLCKIVFRKQYPFLIENVLWTNNCKSSAITGQRNVVINNQKIHSCTQKREKKWHWQVTKIGPISHPTQPTAPRWQDLGATSYFTLLETIYVARGIAMFMSFDLVILFLEIIYRFMMIFNNSVSGYVHVIIVINVIN